MIFKRIKDIAAAELGARLQKKNRQDRPHCDTEWEERIHHDEEDTDSATSLDHSFSQEQRYYANLELDPGADFATIRAQYRRLMKDYHPDRYSDDQSKQQIAETIAQGINEAYNYFEKKHRGSHSS
ncbi:MAG: J domain-containing protein [Zetaproteobacteria bacterium]|nr:J domain-containing protein [Zetaproteobacteria bacterium]